MLTKLNKIIFIAILLSYGISANAIEACDENTQVYETVADLIPLPDLKTTTYEAIPSQCIEASMDLMDSLVKAKKGKFKPFAYCSVDFEKPQKSSTPLCRTEKLISKIQSTFQLAMDCLDIPSKAIFPLINVESGFYPNASAPGGEDAGIGQVTPIAATDVESHWDWLTEHVNNSPKESCKAIQPHLAAIRLANLNSQYICQMVDPQINPLRNSLYTGYIFLLNSKYYRDYFLENKVENRLGYLVGRPLASNEIDEIIHLLNIVTYNMGFDWTRTKFVKFLETQEAKSALSWEDLTALSDKITQLEQDIQKAKDENNFELAQQLRDELQAKTLEFDSILKNKQGKSLPIETFYYRNFKKDSLIGFLKQEDSSRYIELVISRNDAVEKKLGEGTCSDFKNVKASSALNFMKWH